MNAPGKLDPGQAQARLSGMTIFELRREWRRLHRMAPPKRVSRDNLIRAIIYKLQERAYGRLPKATLRRLANINAAGSGATDAAKPAAIILKPGTRLVREWHGVTHSVLVREDGLEWRGQCYRSLSKIALEITGSRWSGPRFFGLRRPVSSSAADEVGHGKA